MELLNIKLLTLASKWGLLKICYDEKKNIVAAVANVFCQSKVLYCQLHRPAIFIPTW